MLRSLPATIALESSLPCGCRDAAHEALRDLVRARLAAKRDQLRARHRLSKFLRRHGRRAPEGSRPWSEKYLNWIKAHVCFEHHAQELTLGDYLHEVEHAAERILRLERSIDASIERLPVKMRTVIEALQSLRGIAQISAVSIMAEVGELSRFAHPRQLMGYSGAVCREHSSGPRIRRGPISKAGNAHLRRIVVEAAWAYRHRPAVGQALATRQRRSNPAVIALAWKAQQRLHRRYLHLTARGKNHQQTITAVGRELLGFIWAIGVHVEREVNLPLLRQAA